MFSDEPCTPGHQLKHKSQMLLMEMDDKEPKDEEIEQIERNGVATVTTNANKSRSSINALSGTPNYQTEVKWSL